MKKIIAFLAASACSISMAAAADIDSLNPAFPTKGLESGRTPFAGAYFGVQAGGEIHAIELFETVDGISASGLTAGIHGGYRWVIAPGFRAGVWAEGGATNVSTTIGGTDLLAEDYYAAGGGEICGVRSTTAICLRGGYQVAQWSSDLLSQDIIVPSWVAGASIETMVSDHVSAGLVADYVALQSAEIGGADVTDAVRGTDGLRVTARLTYRP